MRIFFFQFWLSKLSGSYLATIWTKKIRIHGEAQGQYEAKYKKIPLQIL